MRALAVACTLCLMLICPALAQHASVAARISAPISPEELGEALRAFAKESNLQVLYRTELVAGVKTRGAAGNLTVNEALTALLRGTGLTYRYVDSRTVTLQQVAALAPPNRRTTDRGQSRN